MRTATLVVEITAVADASETRIREAILRELRRALPTPPGVGWAWTEDGARVRVTDIEARSEWPD